MIGRGVTASAPRGGSDRPIRDLAIVAVRRQRSTPRRSGPLEGTHMGCDRISQLENGKVGPTKPAQ